MRSVFISFAALKKPVGYLKLFGMLFSLLCMVLFVAFRLKQSDLSENYGGENTEMKMAGLFRAVWYQYWYFMATFTVFTFSGGVFTCVYLLMGYICEEAEFDVPFVEIVYGLYLGILHLIVALICFGTCWEMEELGHLFLIVIAVLSLIATIIYIIDAFLAYRRNR